MSEYSLSPLKFFRKNEKFALVGASSSWTDHAYYLFLELEKKGYNITPLHTHETVICGVPAFPDFLHIPEVDRVIFASKDEELSLFYLRKMRDTGILKAWFEDGFSTPAMEEFARQNFFEVVKNINLLDTLQKI